MAKVTIGLPETDMKALAAEYTAAMARLNEEWPDLSALPPAAQTALEALRENQRLQLKAWKFVWQRLNERR